MTLAEFRSMLIAIVWTGFFVLEGFGFGVGVADHGGRRHVRRLSPAGTPPCSPASTALALLLAALMARRISFEYRGKRDSPRWRRTWDALMTAGSLLAPRPLSCPSGVTSARTAHNDFAPTR